MSTDKSKDGGAACEHSKPLDGWCRHCVAEKMAAYRRAGQTIQSIATGMGYPPSTVSRWIKKWARSSEVERSTFNRDDAGSIPAEPTTAMLKARGTQ